MVIADNGCAPVTSTISVKLTECPTCLDDENRHSGAGNWDSEISNDAPRNSRAYSTNEYFEDVMSATVGKIDVESVAARSSECQVPRQVE